MAGRRANGQVWVVAEFDSWTAIYHRLDGRHDDAVSRAKALAMRLVRAAANHVHATPDYEVINQQGERVKLPFLDHGIWDLVQAMSDGDADPRYRQRDNT